MQEPQIFRKHNNSPKGSEWNKWDLHFHTPSSYDYQDKSITDEDIINTLVERGICAVAITDHHRIDVARIENLTKVANGKITIFPGIEFRSELGGSETIHYIGIFSEMSDVRDLWTKISGKLDITESDVAQKGNDSIYCPIVETCKVIHELGGIVTVHAGGKTNSIESIKNNQQFKRALKKDLVENSIDIFELGAVDDQDDYCNIVFPNIGQVLPMIICSDNHNIKNYIVKQNLWIKAVPTFEGLKQILYEPTDRVKIQQNKPHIKTPYLVIDKVKFIDNSEQALFEPEWIDLNDNLNVIIGGKSSGKSILLFHIAKTVDEKQVQHKFPNGYNDLSSLIDFEVLWKNEQIDRLKTPEKKGQITYIPQLYINGLAEEGGKEQLYNLIQEIIMQNEDYKNFYSRQMHNKDTIKQEISLCIQQIFILRGQYIDLSNHVKKIGTKEQISAERNRLLGVIEDLRKQSGFSDEENIMYESLMQQLGEQEKKLNALNSFKLSLEQFNRKVAGNKEVTHHAINKEYREFSEKEMSPKIQEIKEELEKSIEQAFKNFLAKSNSELRSTNDQISIEINNIQASKRKLEPFQIKIKNQELLKTNSSALETQKAKLSEIDEKEKEMKSVLEKGKHNNDTLFLKYQELYEIYNNIYSKLQEPEFTSIGEGLALKTHIDFDIDKFSFGFTNLFDLRINLSYFFNDRFNSSNTFVYNHEQHIGNIKTIFDKLPKKDEDSDIRLKTGSSIEDLYTKLFEDYFKVDYSIVHKGDDILKMSPGKRGLVLLQLILHISNSVHPILIDQPEDNLDNRTIYDELKQFVKDKKTKRQIVLVTHNANLVVSTDAENIIVANQAGQQFGKEARAYKFEYISGPLEHSFKDESQKGVLFQYGIREHVCDILEGGKEAFQNREKKYGFR